MWRTVAAVAAATGLLSAVAAAAPAPAPQNQLEPISPWRLDYGDERCVLARNFANGTANAHLQIETFGRWNEFHVLLSGNVVPEQSGASGKVNVRFNGDPDDIEHDDLQGKVGQFPSVYFQLRFIPYAQRGWWSKLKPEEQRKLAPTQIIHPDPQFEATVESLSFRFGRRPAVTLDLKSMARPLAAIRTCVDALVKSWGGDPETQKNLSREAAPTKQTVRKVQDDYPPAMLMSGNSAFVPVRLSVDAAGRVSNCVVQLDNVDSAFRQAVCQNLAGEFEPALDKDGKPVPTILSTGVIYKIAG